jgi:hypothetical protein
LSDPGDLSLLIGNNTFITSSTEFKMTIIVFHDLVRYSWTCSASVSCWYVMPKFANLTNERIIKVVGIICRKAYGVGGIFV